MQANNGAYIMHTHHTYFEYQEEVQVPAIVCRDLLSKILGQAAKKCVCVVSACVCVECTCVRMYVSKIVS